MKWYHFRVRSWNWLLNLLYTEEELERLYEDADKSITEVKKR